MTLQQALEWRYATKVFDATKKLSDADLNDLLTSLQMAPSSFGLQPWKFFVITNPELREKLKAVSWNQSQVTDASHLIVLARQTDMTATHIQTYIDDIKNTRGIPAESLEGYKQMMSGFIAKFTPEERASWMEKQIYIALGFLMLAAATKGIDACPMEGFDAKAYDDILGLNAQGYTTTVLCPVGYRSQNDTYATLKKVRYPLSQVVSFG
jgi:nitroreductase